MSAILIIGLIIIGVALGFGINWLLAKGLIWVMYELFKVDWRDKFWPVFVGLIILSTILSCVGRQQTR